ncbi:hypothetical protein HBA55_29550 [Pseudomaricurvus alkylphenolicus]|uniref:hypothetical protein n=1 Tax=Pseudomaricurvus alkylphenolicus TaxID=1306991 RepID=UPI001421E2FA|nr:hypothetical protein [Pseudomaricurvus alkylphenolicus]NIB43784.1 hypothetical protein [Pseudomaricurvus alkylphenolicus]
MYHDDRQRAGLASSGMGLLGSHALTIAQQDSAIYQARLQQQEFRREHLMQGASEPQKTNEDELLLLMEEELT